MKSCVCKFFSCSLRVKKQYLSVHLLERVEANRSFDL